MDTCTDCRHCHEGYCEVYEKRVNTSSSSCPEFEERWHNKKTEGFIGFESSEAFCFLYWRSIMCDNNNTKKYIGDYFVENLLTFHFISLILYMLNSGS